MVQDSIECKGKQGIVTILGSDAERTTKAVPSLRRTLSADMSSQKWISHMKKVASSHEISISIADGSESQEGRGGLEIWNSIQEEKNKKGAENDFWSSMISQKDADSSKSSALYIHPLVIQSSSSLSEKSLEICTESLGSETGSDGFSSYPPSETGDRDEEDDEEVTQHDGIHTFEHEEWRPVKYNYKKSPPRSFPPPLPSLSCPDGGSLLMQPRRDNGRLVLDAIAVPSQNNFRAQREDGHLVLTLVNPIFVEQVMNREEKQEDEFEETEEETKPEGRAPEFPCGLLNAHRLAVIMNRKSIILANRNHSTPIAHSLPPRPKVAQLKSYSSPPTSAAATAAASLNACDSYWRSKPTAKEAIAVNPLGQQSQSFKNSGRKIIVCKNRKANEQQQLVLPNGGCKDVRRSLLFWEHHCIATS